MTEMTCAAADATEGRDTSHTHEEYDGLLRAIGARFAAVPTDARLFTTNVEGLFDTFLSGLPAERRQHYRCNACRRFCERFGGIVDIDPTGDSRSLMWDPDVVPTFFRRSVADMATMVQRAKVTGVFLSEEKVWGLPVNRDKARACQWHHMSVTPPADRLHKPSVVVTTDQRMAELREEHGMLARAVAEFPADIVGQAYTLLSAESLYRSEKVLGVATWLRDLHAKLSASKDGARRQRLLWYAAATAPVGFCHVRSTMIGTLLADLAEGKPIADVAAAFKAKMHPLQYQRPTAAPTEGNRDQAEKIVAALGSAGALARRFARLEDVTEKLWTSREARPHQDATGGVFAHVKTKEQAATATRGLDLPDVTMTWVKFEATVLPTATQIECLMPHGAGPFVALVTAVDPAAPPILQWDREERRNPVSWYHYVNGSPASRWGLTAGSYVRVTAVTRKPSMWGGGHEHQGKDVFFLLDGARDTMHVTGGGFFPEMLRSEYHAVRKTIEAHVRGAAIAGRAEANACGIAFAKQTFRVTSQDGSRRVITLDRWD